LRAARCRGLLPAAIGCMCSIARCASHTGAAAGATIGGHNSHLKPFLFFIFYKLNGEF